MNTPNQRQRVIVFDVNETLLDIEFLSPYFKHTFGDASAMRQWFSELVLYSQSLTLSGGYTPFGELAAAVLQMVGEIRGIAISHEGVEEFAELMSRLPAHHDAAPALQMLQDAGFRLITLTNSAPPGSMALVERAGLGHYFEKQFSVDAVKRFKPATQVYRSVEAALGLQASALRMVAAHTWDTLGAAAAGWKTALVTRPGNAALLVGEQPDIIENDLLAIATRIIELDVA